MPPRFHVDAALDAGQPLELPPGAARHVQVLRLQPGDALTLFDGRGGEWAARVERIGRSSVEAVPLVHDAVEREIGTRVTLALGMPANDRMDTLVEKAAELGAAGIQPLMTERSVLRLTGERAEKKRAHWQAIAIAACEQCGRNRVPRIEPVRPLAAWLAALGPVAAGDARWLLGFGAATRPLAARLARSAGGLLVLSGPEGGLAPAEVAAAEAAGFGPTTLGPAVLRADTAPLAALAAVALHPGVAATPSAPVPGVAS